MWKNRLLYFAALLGVILFFIEYPGWISRYALILVVVLPFFSLVSALLPARRLFVSLAVPEEVRRGEETTLSVSVSLLAGQEKKRDRKSDLPCGMTLAVRNLRTGREERTRLVLTAGKRRHLRMENSHCAAVSIGIRHAGTWDPLGIFRIPVRSERARMVWIVPSAKSPVPPPDFSAFHAAAVHPKRGGGFAEIHELREYRPGDPVRDIHWKLTAKTGRPIVREAEEPEIRKVVVTLDMRKDPARFDSVMDECLYVGEQLLRRHITFLMIWRSPKETGLCTEEIRSRQAFREVVHRLLGICVTEDPPSLASEPFDDAAWRFHIGGEEQT